ncbi:MAG: S8 family serine peptidase [Chloroflexota bacterium]
MKRLSVMLAVTALLVGILAPTAQGADPKRQFKRIDISKIDPSFRPFMADAARKLTVVVELAGDPANAVAGLTGKQRETHAKALKGGQSSVEASIKRLGGKVLDDYQYAYNGIKVQTSASKLAALAALPGVTGIRALRTYKLDNVNAVPYIGVPGVWQFSGETGAGQTIAVIDTGIDYTHANFGGPGTPEAYSTNDPTVIETGTFPTAKVIAGYDFAGNAYNANIATSVPAPDADPLDCNSHGTHVAGTAAGQGVKADHSTYTGPYDGTTFADPAAFTVAPGVAPQASLVALKVFGCEGSTNLVVDALEWVAEYNATHADGIDVVNMSLGSEFGAADDPDAIATDNLVKTGVVVVASAGNSGPLSYITGSPAAATQAISVAALDAFPSIPMALVDLPDPATDIPGNNQNAYPLLPFSGTLHVLADGSGGVKLGCDLDDFDAASAGAIVAVKRGDCAFVDKLANAAEAGATGVIVINRDNTAPGDLPTFIGYNPEFFTGPMIGVDKTAQPSLLANEGAAISLNPNGSTPNPTFKKNADFSSGGPRYGDSAMKPDVSAPGVNLLSSLNGSGWNGTTFSGTSMASPMTAGTAALVRQAHPDWSPLKVKAALVNTADSGTGSIVGYDPRIAGSGVIQANLAVDTVGLATTSDGTASLSFGYEQIDGNYSETKKITIQNTSGSAIRYNLSATSSLVSINPSSVTVGANSSKTVKVTARLSRAQAAALPTADQFFSGDFGDVNDFAGAVVAVPTTAADGVFPLRVPYLLVPRGLSDVKASLGKGLDESGGVLSGSLNLSNKGIHDGIADVYAWGLSDARGDGAHGTDLRAVGVQSFPGQYLWSGADPSDMAINFAVNSWDRFTVQAPNEIDIAIDTTGDGVEDYFVIGLDEGLLFTGDFDEFYLSLVFDATTFDLLDAWLADAPFNGSTVLLPLLASDIGLTAGDGGFTYWVAAYDGFTGAADVIPGEASFDPFGSEITTGDFVPLAPGDKVSVPVSFDMSAGMENHTLGWMVVGLDDRNGGAQADLIRPMRNHHRGHDDSRSSLD